jgi:hypothetical protein
MHLGTIGMKTTRTLATRDWIDGGSLDLVKVTEELYALRAKRSTASKRDASRQTLEARPAMVVSAFPLLGTNPRLIYG